MSTLTSKLANQILTLAEVLVEVQALEEVLVEMLT